MWTLRKKEKLWSEQDVPDGPGNQSQGLFHVYSRSSPLFCCYWLLFSLLFLTFSPLSEGRQNTSTVRKDIPMQGMMRLTVQKRVLRRIVTLKVMSRQGSSQQVQYLTFRMAGTSRMSHSTDMQNSVRSTPMSTSGRPSSSSMWRRSTCKEEVIK